MISSHKNYKEEYIDPIQLADLSFDYNGNIKEGSGNVQRFVVCNRPAHRSGLPVIESKIVGEQIISHNYCHTGIGYSILFGSVNQCVSLFLKNNEKMKYLKNEEITIIGSGIMGLLTSIKLHSLGFTNLIIRTLKNNEIPSQLAGGLIELALIRIHDKEHFSNLNHLFEETFLEYQKIHNDKNHFLHNSVDFIPFYSDVYHEGVGLSYLIDKGIIEPRKKVLLKIRGTRHSGFYMNKINTYYVIPVNFMESLTKKINELKLKVVYEKVESIKDLKSKIIFNCSSFGSAYLNKDSKIYSICGHGLRLDKQDIKKTNYIIRFNSIPGMDSKYNGSFYFMPQTNGFIGGTYLKNYNGDDSKFNLENLNKLVRRALYLYCDVKPKF